MFVLILVVAFAGSGITSIRVDEYSTVEKCRAAALTVMTQKASPVLAYLCVPRDPGV